ncbi:hypothetical protein TPS_04069 [Trichinella pseudospiralis]
MLKHLSNDCSFFSLKATVEAAIWQLMTSMRTLLKGFHRRSHQVPKHWAPLYGNKCWLASRRCQTDYWILLFFPAPDVAVLLNEKSTDGQVQGSETADLIRHQEIHTSLACCFPNPNTMLLLHSQYACQF